MALLYVILLHLISHLALTTSAVVFDRAPGGVPDDWEEVGTPDAGDQLKLRIALRQQNVEYFDQTVLAVSTPGNPLYGKHLQAKEIRDILQPTTAATSTVLAWLEAADIHDVHDDGDWIHFRTNVSSANSLLDANFMWYRSPYQGNMLLRTVEYSLPEDIAQHVNLVQPTTRFGSGRPLGSQYFSPQINNNGMVVQASGVPTDGACNQTIYPSCLLQLYNIHYKPKSNNGNKVGIASFLEQYSRSADRANFYRRFAPWATDGDYTSVKFGDTPSDPEGAYVSLEANLNVQYVSGVSGPVPVVEYQTAGRGPTVGSADDSGGVQSTRFYNSNDRNSHEPFLDYLLGLREVKNEDLPQTISHSYGEDEQSVPEAYARQICQMFGELGLRGVSVIFASGDSGVGSYCAANDNPESHQFQAMFPSACPTVTSVGGTQSIPEVASAYSGGGFSRLFPRPDYQVKHIENYFREQPDRNSTFGRYFDPKNRGFPDVSAQSYRYALVDKAKIQALQGTSASAPAFAGIVALLNGARIDIGLPPLGFLNPWLYGDAAHAFTDITEGASTGCDGYDAFKSRRNGSPVIPGAGWNASVGWDPVTGLGTPDFGKLLAVAAPGVLNEGGPSLGGLPGSTAGSGDPPTNGTAGAAAISNSTVVESSGSSAGVAGRVGGRSSKGEFVDSQGAGKAKVPTLDLSGARLD